MNDSLLDLCSSALSTNSIIFETVLSPKSLVVFTRITPVRLTQPEITSSPTLKSLGMLSPVRAIVLRDDVPSMIFPSRGTFSPGLMTMISPTFTFSGETVTNFPPISTLATSGRISIRCEMLPRLFPSA